MATYILEGNLGRLRIAPPRAPRRAGKLWEHTCCEIFIGRKDLPGYHEFNLAPSIAMRRAAGQLEIEARIRLDHLGYGGSLAIGLSAVVEDENGALSYWALNHPPGKPDFHHREAFALQLDETRH